MWTKRPGNSLFTPWFVGSGRGVGERMGIGKVRLIPEVIAPDSGRVGGVTRPATMGVSLLVVRWEGGGHPTRLVCMKATWRAIDGCRRSCRVGMKAKGSQGKELGGDTRRGRGYRGLSLGNGCF